MFAVFNHDEFPIVRVTLNNNIENNEDFENFLQEWLRLYDNSEYFSFEFENKLVITFELDDEQFKIVQDNIDVYGHSRIGKSKTLKMLPNQKLWRHPLITSNHTTYLCWDDEPDSIES